MEDDLWGKMTLSGIRPLCKPNFGGDSPLSTTEPKSELLSVVSAQDRIYHRGKMYVALCMHTCAEKMIFLGKDD